ncbi:MAG: 50S ribosomal protein L18 [Verrucomicrobiae bacterium]|nr:50S ribosomal protein L18 [Verrucomicrobiae bacterium]
MGRENIDSKHLTARKRIHLRIRKKVEGTAQRPRLAVHFSGKHVYAQVIDDVTGVTLASASTTEKTLKAKDKGQSNIKFAGDIGKLAAERALQKNIKAVVFDRGGFKYHGKVKALAEAARAAGLQF